MAKWLKPVLLYLLGLLMLLGIVLCALLVFAWIGGASVIEVIKFQLLPSTITLPIIIIVLVAFVPLAYAQRSSTFNTVKLFSVASITVLVTAALLGVLRLPIGSYGSSSPTQEYGVLFSPTEVGYLYDPAKILQNLQEIKAMGFTAVEVPFPLEYFYKTDDPYSWNMFGQCLQACHDAGLKIMVRISHVNDNQMEIVYGSLQKTVSRLAEAYWSIVNIWLVMDELEGIHKPSGSPYMVSELVSVVNGFVKTIHDYDVNCRTAVSFSSGFELWRSDLVAALNSFSTTYLGLDIYEQQQGIVAIELSYLRSMCNKPIIIPEFGSPSQNSVVKVNYINSWIDFYRKNGVDIMFAFDWDLGIYALKNTTLSLKQG